MSNADDETHATLRTLEKLIAIAECVGMRTPRQRAALAALRRRRTALRELLLARPPREDNVIHLATYRSGAARASRRKPDAVAAPVPLGL